MENFDNIYKKHFQDEQDGLSNKEEMQLWDSIVEELGPEDSKIIEKKKFWNSKLFFGLLTAGIICSAYLIGQYQGINNSLYNENVTINEGKEQKIDKIPQSESQGITTPNVSQKINQSPREKIDISTENINNEIQDNRSSLDDLSYDLNDLKEKSTKLDKALKTKENNNYFEYKSIDNVPYYNNDSNQATTTFEKKISNGFEKIVEELSSENSLNDSEENKYTSSDSNDVKKEQVNEFESNNVANSSSIESQQNLENGDVLNYETNPIFEENRDLYITSNVSQFPIEFFEVETKALHPVLNPVSPKKSDFLYSFGLNAGVNKSGILYTGLDPDFIMRKNETERSYYGYNMGLDMGLTYKGKWLLRTGVHYELQQTIYEETWINEIVWEGPFDEGVIVNPSTFQIVDYIKDENSKIYKSENRLKQINTFKSVLIPIQLGWKMNRNRAAYGMMAGSVIRIRQSQLGTILGVDGELVELDKGANHFYNSINLGLSLSPFFEYRISNRIGCRASYNIDIYKPTVSLTSEVNLYNYTQSISLGVNYYINEM